MKKKVLITLFMLVSAVFVLAISANALTLQESIDIYEGYFDGKTVESIDGIEASEHINPQIYADYADTVVNARVELNCSCGSTHTYPTYYITKFYDTDVTWGHDRYTLYAKEIFNVSFDDINAKNPCNATYDKNMVVAIEIPDGYKVIDGGCAKTDCKSYMAGLRDSTSLKFIDMTTCTTVTRLDATANHEAFGNCYALEYVKLADSVTEIGGWAFDECTSLKRVVVSENSQLKIMKAKSFFGCTSLEAFYLPEGFETFTGNNQSNEASFVKCTSLYFVSEPDELTKPDVYYFPSSLKAVEYEAFKNCNSINKCLVFGENVTKITGSWTFATNKEGIARTPETAITIVFLGNMTNFAFSDEMAYVSVVFANPNQGDISYTAGGTNQEAYIYKCAEGVRSTLSKTLNFTSEGFSHYVEAENVGASYNSFLESGYGVDRCFCGHEFLQEEERFAPLFACLGYSSPENGTGGIAIGFTVNKEAISEYEAVTGKTVNYGVFAVLKDRLGDNDVFAEDGTASEGVINADITNYEFAAFELKIVGFTDEQKDTKLVMGAYVAVTDGKTTEYSYLQSGTPNENEKYCFISYNDIVGNPSSDDEVTQ